MGRLVLNHSTNIEGLIPILQKLALDINIKTITPAAISRSRGRSSKLIIRLSVKTINGYKAIARKGKTAQEVFISTDLSKNESDKNKMNSDIFEKLNLSANKAEKDIGIYKSSISKMEQAKELIEELRIKDKKKDQK